MTDPTPSDLNELAMRLREFADERDWEQFHSPKNLAMALAVEAAELLEVFQWLTEEESRRLPPERHGAASEEAADVLLYLVRLCDQLGIDLIAAAGRKLAINAVKYPVATSRGNYRKHPESGE